MSLRKVDIHVVMFLETRWPLNPRVDLCGVLKPLKWIARHGTAQATCLFDRGQNTRAADDGQRQNAMEKSEIDKDMGEGNLRIY